MQLFSLWWMIARSLRAKRGGVAFIPSPGIPGEGDGGGSCRRAPFVVRTCTASTPSPALPSSSLSLRAEGRITGGGGKKWGSNLWAMLRRWLAALMLPLAMAGCHSQAQNANAPIAPAAVPQQFSYSDWADFLSAAVTPDGYVKWDTVRSDDGVRQSELKIVGLTNAVSPVNHPELFVGLNDRLAYWINAFNAMTVYAVIEHNYPPTMLAGEPAGAIFSEEKFTFGGSQLTLDQLSRQIYDEAGDARVYFAINFCAVSSPPLRNEPYQGEVLEEQLIDQTQRFLGDPRAAVRDGDAVKLNNLLLYMHKAEFLAQYQKLLGRAPGGILQALQPFALPDSPLAGATKVESLGFDWSLNRPPK
jgi:hypothetical protein